MKVIKVTKEQLEKIKDQLSGGDFEDGPYETAYDLGFPGFAGGLDRIEKTENSVTIYDRGVSRGGHIFCNTTEFRTA